MTRRKSNNLCSKRKLTKTILINGEGDFLTEKVYIKELSDSNNGISINYIPGRSSDPVKIVKEMIDKINELKSNNVYFENEDLVFCLFDTDFEKEKNKQIEEAIKLAYKNKIKVIISNPSIEIWFALHNEFFSGFISKKELDKKMDKMFDNYKKGGNYYQILKPNTNDAIKNAKKLEKIHRENNSSLFTVECNPYTNMYELVEVLLDNPNKNKK